MFIKRACLGTLFCIAGLAASPAWPREIPRTLTLEDAVRLAVERNPGLAAAREGLRVLEGDRIAAGKRPNPLLGFEAEDYPIASHPGPLLENLSLTLRLDFEIERGDRRRWRTEAADHAVAAGRLDYEDSVRLLRLEVARVFADAVLAQADLAASRSLLDRTEGVISLNRVRLEQGEISLIELHRIEAEKLRYRDEAFRAELLLRNAKSALMTLLSAPASAPEPEIVGALDEVRAGAAPGRLPEASLPELVRIARERRPDFRMGRREEQRAAAEAQLERSLRSPNITVGGGYRRNDVDHSFVLGVSLPLRLFDRNEGGILRAEAGRARAEHLAAARSGQVELEVRQAANAAAVHRARVDYIRREHLVKAEESGRVTLAAYNLGGATLIDYLDAQRTYYDTLRLYHQALHDERVSLHELAAATGTGGE
ncbi:MAG: TolC family protein [Acidobacteria bacterium]|nr:TolC family protein [Acidobacteriota bacterium]